MASHVLINSVLALLCLLPSHLTFTSPSSLSSTLSASSESLRKTLVKRPVIPVDPVCDADYGRPDYLACLISVSWIPPHGDNIYIIRHFGPMPQTESEPLSVQLPMIVSADIFTGNCFIRVAISEVAGRSSTEWETWKHIREAASEVTHRCVGARGSGGTIATGEGLGISVTVYSESSVFKDTLIALAQTSSDSLCESAGSNEASTE
ncbi:MAG: hypothetical protein M1835_001221, partial [Candelina submexicana]